MLPFSRLSAQYFNIAGLAVDKVMAPVLVLIWVGLLLVGKANLDKSKLLLLVHVFVFFIVRNVSFIDNASLFTELLWRDAILLGYFALPVLFIDTLKRVDVAARLVSVNAVVACLSAFLVALSIIELPYERFSESRIGYEGIQKSIGVITSYGDVTQLATFFLLFGLFMSDKILPAGKKTQKLIKLIVLLVVVMGLIGNQSRSYLLSLIFAYVAVLFYSYRGKKLAKTSLVDALAVLSVVVIFPFIMLMLSEIVATLAGIGGKEAMGSASARLGQYEMAFSLIRENPLFGVGSDFYVRNPYFAHGVHNMWLGQWTRGGFVSVLLLLILMINVFRKCVGLFKNENVAGYAKVLTGYLAAVFLSTLFYPADSDIFWALLGMSASIIYLLNGNKTKVTDISVDNVSDVDMRNKRILHKRENS